MIICINYSCNRVDKFFFSIKPERRLIYYLISIIFTPLTAHSTDSSLHFPPSVRFAFVLNPAEGEHQFNNFR